MQIIIIMAFIVGFSALQLPIAAEPGWLIVPAGIAYVLIAVAIATAGSQTSLRTMRNKGEMSRSATRRHGMLVMLSRIWLVVGTAWLVLMGYGEWIESQFVHLPLIGAVVLFVPFLVALLGVWWAEYPFYRAVKQRVAEQQRLAGVNMRDGWSLGEYFSYNIRHSLLFIAVPISLIVLISDCLGLYLAPLLPPDSADAILLSATLLAAICVFLFAPLIIVRIWRTERLQPGPLRDELEEIGRSLKLRYRDILIWRSGGMIINAGVMGLIGPVRYVLLTDAMIEHMDRRCTKAIFAHEAGHIVSHHILYSVIFAMSAAVLSQLATLGISATMELTDWAVDITSMVILLLFWGFGFGWLSRRFERQSDVLAAWTIDRPAETPESEIITAEGAATFSWSLQKVAELNGIRRDQFNWRHGSMATRINYILALAATGRGRSEIDRTVRRIKLGLWLALACSLAGGVAVILAY